MSGYHVGLEAVAEGFCEDYGVEEYCGLGHFGLLEVVFSAFKHEVGDAEAEDFVCFFKEFACGGVVVVEVFAHAYELCSLAGKNKCVHNLIYVIICFFSPDNIGAGYGGLLRPVSFLVSLVGGKPGAKLRISGEFQGRKSQC